MTGFVEQFASQLKHQRLELQARWALDTQDADEARLRCHAMARWNSDNEPDAGRGGALSPTNQRSPAFAADGSGATRYLSNGWAMIVAQALLVGPGVEEPALEVRFVRTSMSRPVIERFAELLMRSLELRVALARARQMNGGVLCIDGSLQADFPHLLYGLNVKREAVLPFGEGDDVLPFTVLGLYLDLFEACQRNEILLVGISKTSAARFFGEALMGLDAEHRDTIPPDIARSEAPVPPPLTDAEMLARWTSGAGYTCPLLLGVHALGHRRSELLRSPVEASSSPRASALQRLREAPAIIALHVRLRAGEQTLRVDVPSTAVGLEFRINDCYFRWAESESVEPVRRRLREGYGGPNVYQAASYVADRLVRLRRQMVDGPFLALLRSVTGQHLTYDRSTQRFL